MLICKGESWAVQFCTASTCADLYRLKLGCTVLYIVSTCADLYRLKLGCTVLYIVSTCADLYRLKLDSSFFYRFKPVLTVQVKAGLYGFVQLRPVLIRIGKSWAVRFRTASIWADLYRLKLRCTVLYSFNLC